MFQLVHFTSKRKFCLTVTPPQPIKAVLPPLHTEFGLMELLSALQIRAQTECFK
jgi:hypothetical protein